MWGLQDHATNHRTVNRILVWDFVTLITLILDFANSVNILVEDAKIVDLSPKRDRRNARKFVRVINPQHLQAELQIIQTLLQIAPLHLLAKLQTIQTRLPIPPQYLLVVLPLHPILVPAK